MKFSDAIDLMDAIIEQASAEAVKIAEEKEKIAILADGICLLMDKVYEREDLERIRLKDSEINKMTATIAEIEEIYDINDYVYNVKLTKNSIFRRVGKFCRKRMRQFGQLMICKSRKK